MSDDDVRKLVLASPPESVHDLSKLMEKESELRNGIRLQYMDPAFNNCWVNLTSIDDVKDKSSLNGWQLAKMKKSIPDISLP